MAREVTLRCDNCNKKVEKIAAKIYLAPTFPNKPGTAFQSAYSHYGDLCNDCMTKLIPKMKRRAPRNGKPAIKSRSNRSKKKAST